MLIFPGWRVGIGCMRLQPREFVLTAVLTLIAPLSSHPPPILSVPDAPIVLFRFVNRADQGVEWIGLGDSVLSVGVCCDD